MRDASGQLPDDFQFCNLMKLGQRGFPFGDGSGDALPKLLLGSVNALARFGDPASARRSACNRPGALRGGTALAPPAFSDCSSSCGPIIGAIREIAGVREKRAAARALCLNEQIDVHLFIFLGAPVADHERGHKLQRRRS